MKVDFAIILAAAVSVNALSDCILDCQASVATSAGCDSDYNTTTCYCDNADYPTKVKACLYQSSCSTDVNTFYTYREEWCGGDAEESTATTKTNETVADTNGVLGECILGCQAEAAVTAGCTTSNYNDTACYCDNDNFATDVKVCLYQNCSSEVPIFYNYASSVCGGANSTEYFNSVTAADPTSGIVAASSTLVAATSAATATGAGDSASATSASGAASSETAVSAAARDVAFVSGLAAAVGFAMMIIS